MKRGVASGWIHRRPETDRVLAREKSALLDKQLRALLEGNDTRTEGEATK